MNLPIARALVPLLALLAAVGCSTPGADGGASRSVSAQARPNVVLIMADDLGWGELGSYGQEIIRTPSLDRLAAEGMRFTRHYAGAPVCAPSRCVLLTGLHTGHSLVRDNWEAGGWGPDEPEGQYPLPPGTETLGTLFQRAGYATAAIGKWGLGGPGSTGEPNRQGFDHFFGYLCQRVAHNHYPTHLWSDGERVELEGNVWGNAVGKQYAHDLMAEEALDFVRANRARPFFLYLPFHVPHLALQAPPDSLAEYAGAFDDPPYEGGKGYLPQATPRAAYAAMVTRMDRDIGRLMALLAELGLDEDTLVLFTSDNGATYDVGGADSPFFGSHGPFRGAKGSVYEGGLRVPLIARWPGHVAPGTVSDHVSAFQDHLATYAELLGMAPAGPIDGLSFLPTLLGRPQPEHDHLYFEFPGYGGQQALVRGDWKAVRRGMRKGETAIALYDLAADPGESSDVAASHPALVGEIRGLLEAEHAPSEVFPLPVLDVPVEAGAGGG